MEDMLARVPIRAYGQTTHWQNSIYKEVEVPDTYCLLWQHAAALARRLVQQAFQHSCLSSSMKYGLRIVANADADGSRQRVDEPAAGGFAAPASAARNQIDSLTATRAIAAVLVFIHHFGPGEIFPPYWRIGNIAVGYFFVLSGFVLYFSYSYRQAGYADFLKRRVARIVPVYLLALFLMICPPERHFECILTSARAVKEALLSATLLQAYVPTYPLTLNLPGWTISVEMFFYVLFPVLLRMEKGSILRFMLFSTGLFVASQCIHLYFYPIRQNIGDTVCDTVFFSPFIHLSQFLLGMISGYIFQRLKGRFPKYRLLPLLLFILCIGAVAIRTRYPHYLSFQVGLIDPLFMLLILSIAINNPAWLRLRAFVFLGEISYGIYILQWPVYLYLSAMNDRHWHIPPQRFFYAALAALILFATLSYYLFELPLKRRINAIRIGTVKG